MVTLYGIKNCDTVRKARRWLECHEIEYRFHDVRSDGLTLKQLNGWIRETGWEDLLNRRGTTWRKLEQTVRDSVNGRSAVQLMLEHPALIKRPVLELDKHVHIGFSETDWQAMFEKIHP